MLLRIEDIDSSRSRAEYINAIEEDLTWLGIKWDGEVRIQSHYLEDYKAAIDRLMAMGLTYPCFCTRKEIQAELKRSADAPQGPDGPVYPGTCRDLSVQEREERLASGAPWALRLNAALAATRIGNLIWIEGAQDIKVDPLLHGDFVLRRKDLPTSYHVSVVVDDALQGVTLVTRGRDLLASTHAHRVLQALLDLPVPRYLHHALVVDEAGRRLAKRDDARSVRSFREAGMTAAQVLDAARAAVQDTAL